MTKTTGFLLLVSLLAAAVGFGLTATIPCRAQAVAAKAMPNEPSLYPDVLRQADVMVKMRDGVELATDIYRPAHNHVAEDETLPVLLHRTPYDKAAPDATRCFILPF